jgi:predicted nucleic-acid-binding protein
MIALDTNVLVRFLVEDDVEQTRRATALVRAAVDRDIALFVADVVICELVWVLETAYRVERKEIAEQLSLLLQARHLEFEDGDRLARALESFRTGRGDFADYLVREVGLAAGCEAVATFDSVLLREDRFVRPAASAVK